VAHLKEQLVVRSPVCAALAVHFAAQHTARSSANARNTDFVGVLPVLCGVVQSAIDAHPAVHAQCLAAAKVSVTSVWRPFSVQSVEFIPFYLFCQSIIACAGSILKAGEREDAAKVSVLTSEVGVSRVIADGIFSLFLSNVCSFPLLGGCGPALGPGLVREAHLVRAHEAHPAVPGQRGCRPRHRECYTFSSYSLPISDPAHPTSCMLIFSRRRWCGTCCMGCWACPSA